MTHLFLIVAEQSLRLSGIILFLWALRVLVRKIPGSAFYLLWILVFAGLLFPLRVEVPYSREVPAAGIEAALPTEETGTVPANPAAVEPPAPQGQAALPQSQQARLHLLPLAAAVWAAVFMILLCVNGWKLPSFARRLRGARQISPGVYETHCVEVPLVMGYLHPRIYLPAFLRQEERGYILLHEQIHLRRRDYLIKPAAFAVTLLHWFNPVVWLAYHLLSEDMERACDEAVLRRMGSGIRKKYSMSLLNLSVGQSIHSLPTVAFGERGIQYRVMNILHYKKAGGLTLALLVLLFGAVACGTFAQPVEVTETPQEEQTSQEDLSNDALYQEVGVSTSDVTAFFEQFQQAAAAGDQDTVANMFRYPKQLQLPDQELTYVSSAEEFLPHYDQVFTQDFLTAIGEIDPADFTQDGPSIGWGNGAVWARVYDGEVTMASVFASREDRYLAYYEGNDNELSGADAMYQVNGIRSEEAQAFAEDFVTLARADDREAVASMIRYPRTLVVDGTETTLENTEDFLAHYEEILSEDFISTLESLLAQPLSYRYDGTFLGGGVLWMSNSGGELMVESLFPSDTVQMKPTGDMAVGVEPGTTP